MIDFVKAVVTHAAGSLHGHSRRIIGEKEGVGNVLIDADRELEREIISKIRRRYPGDLIIAEESNRGDIPQHVESGWIIDSFDGSTNGSKGIPFCGISVSYAAEDQVVLAAMYDLGEKALYWAHRGRGAFISNIRGDYSKLSMGDKGLARSVVITSTPYGYADFVPTMAMVEHVYRAGAQVRMFGSSVVDGIYVATNRASLYYEVGVKPWDIAGISLLVTEAGGEVSTWDDQPFFVLAPRVFVCGAKTAVAEFKGLVAKAGIKP